MKWEEYHRQNGAPEEAWDELSERVIGAAIEAHEAAGFP